MAKPLYLMAYLFQGIDDLRIFHLFYVKALLACGVSSFLRHFWCRKWNVNIITLSLPFFTFHHLSKCHYDLCSGYFMSIMQIVFQANWLQNVVPDNIFQIVAMDHFYSLLFWTIFFQILQIPFPDNIFGQTVVMDNIFANCRCEWVTCKFWRLSFKSSL